jgi:integrase
MAIYKRGNYWHMDATINGVRYREPLYDTARKRKVTDRREAIRLEKERAAAILQGKGSSPEGRAFGRKPFRDAADAWVNERKGHVAERSIQFERERLKPLKEFFRDAPLDKIRADDIRAYQKSRLNAGRSGKTINMEVGVLRLMMKRARMWTLVSDDVKLFPKRPTAIGKALTREQKNHLFKTASSSEDWLIAYCAAVLSVSTTCRGVELKGLRWRDIDLFEQTMRLNRSKTMAGHRTIPLNVDAMAAMARLRVRAETIGSDGSDHFVFPACENNHIDPTRHQKSWRSAWRSLRKETARGAGRDAARSALNAGLGIKAAKSAWRNAALPFIGFRFHDLRHQAITELSEAGVSDATLMSMAGHLTREMLEHYSHVRMTAKREAASKLESGLMSPLLRDSDKSSPRTRAN